MNGTQLKAVVTIDFAKNKLQIEVAAGIQNLMRYSNTVGKEWVSVFRNYPVSELEARSLHFKIASPYNFVEQHMLEKMKLFAFEEGYDARGLEFIPSYAPCLTQRETDGQQHMYVWSYDSKTEDLTLTDNGIEIHVVHTSGPQDYQSLVEVMDNIRALRSGVTVHTDEQEFPDMASVPEAAQ